MEFVHCTEVVHFSESVIRGFTIFQQRTRCLCYLCYFLMAFEKFDKTN